VIERLKNEAIEPPGTGAGEFAVASDALRPGALLRREREARGHSVDDVVQVIRFSSRQIEAMERDEYAALPGSTAVRGLVRNYAKFLKIDPAPLLEQLDPAVPVQAVEVRPPANMGQAEQPGIFERIPPKLVGVAIVVLLLALGGYWYSGLPDDSPLKNILVGMAPTPAPELAAPSPVVASEGVTVAAPTPTVLGSNEPAEVAAPATVPPAAPAAAGLHVEFDARSWIEIRDAAQKVLFSGEYPAGTRQNIEGKPPYQIWIGKASAVRVFMGERSIDLKPHTREDVARLKLE
jgi:cytoskeleton protein RodZ